jgi:hypothetical protein
MLTKANFYEGAIINSILKSNQGTSITIGESDTKQKNIKITNNNNLYSVIAKYDAKLPKKVKDGYRWAFTYNTEDIIKLLDEENEKTYFAFLCQKEELDNSRVAIIDMIQLKECLPKQDELKENTIYNIKIYAENNKNYFKCYGSGLLPGNTTAQNGIRIEWNRIAIFA